MELKVIRKVSLPKKLLLIGSFIAAAALIAILVYGGMFPVKYLAVAGGLLLLFWLLLFFWLTKLSRPVASRIFAYLFGLIFMVGTAYGAYAAFTSFRLLDRMTKNSGQVLKFSVITLKDSQYKNIDQIAGQPIVGAEQDRKYVDQVASQTKAGQVEYLASNAELVLPLMQKKKDLIVFNESFRDLVDAVYPKFTTESQVLKTFEFSIETSTAKPLFDKSQVFNVYISGIDTFGPITTVSRSDVNIVATVNMKTKKILLTSIPRDAYVSIPLGGNNQKDKLTHAGIYGIETSEAAVSKLLGVDINAYGRVNFTTLIKLVDKIGGVDVDNPVAFRAGEYNFPKGMLHLDGKKALAYSRERKSLSGGDSDRGVNQERVLKAIFNKVASPAILTNYQSVLGVVEESVQTNVLRSDINKFVNLQLNYGGDWDISMQNITGRSQRGLKSYAMPNNDLSMYVLDQGSLTSAIDKINQTMYEK